MQRARGVALFANVVVAVGLVVACCSACSGSGRAGAIGQPSTREQFCKLLAQLDATGRPVAQANIADPAAFNAVLGIAVQRYAALVEQLQSIAPPQLTADIARLRVDVAQHRFAPAEADHAALAAYAATACR
jgi:hypothetical protein